VTAEALEALIPLRGSFDSLVPLTMLPPTSCTRMISAGAMHWLGLAPLAKVR